MCNINSPFFIDEAEARKYLEAQRWPNGAVCPHCGGDERIYPIKANKDAKVREGLYQCNDCDKTFTVTVGTVFEGSKVPLHKWLMATYMMCSSKKGVSSKQLERSLGVSYKTAWFMSHRIREAMREENGGLLGGSGKTVEVDETFIGRDKNIKPKGMKKGRGYHHKQKVLSIVERGGKVRSNHVPSVKASTLKPILNEQIAKGSQVYTDEAGQYTQTREPMFEKHEFVSHGIGEYVRGDIHTNTIEGYFSIFKRGMKGIYQHCGEQHLKRYLCEYDFRYNYREKLGFDDMARTQIALQGIEGKRVLYRSPN